MAGQRDIVIILGLFASACPAFACGTHNASTQKPDSLQGDEAGEATLGVTQSAIYGSASRLLKNGSRGIDRSEAV